MTRKSRIGRKPISVVASRFDGGRDPGLGQLFFQRLAVEGHEDGGAEFDEAFLGFGGRRDGHHFAVVAGNGLGVAAFFDDEFDRALLGGDDFALFEQFGEFRVGQLVDLGEVAAAENEGAADESEGHGKEEKPPPVELRVRVGAARTAVFGFVAIVRGHGSVRMNLSMPRGKIK
jgi:hypothetical protein